MRQGFFVAGVVALLVLACVSSVFAEPLWSPEPVVSGADGVNAVMDRDLRSDDDVGGMVDRLVGDMRRILVGGPEGGCVGEASGFMGRTGESLSRMPRGFLLGQVSVDGGFLVFPGSPFPLGCPAGFPFRALGHGPGLSGPDAAGGFFPMFFMPCPGFPEDY